MDRSPDTRHSLDPLQTVDRRSAVSMVRTHRPDFRPASGQHHRVTTDGNAAMLESVLSISSDLGLIPCTPVQSDDCG